MIDLSVDNSGETCTLILSGSITIQHATQLKEALLEGISAAKRLMVNLSDLERTDLAVIQLIYAAHRSLMEKGKTLEVEGAIPEAWYATIKEAGYSGCINTNDNCGLWTGEGN
ncbi:MAG: STAS domain-containing protein [Magnetococcales bacterium]|nr:STAS domain-containing protein [Magnetococcales bacterium]MBF0150955.1 STAS domain-containing protein [Magnetococcales bacterium]MBF0172241.1 STAS domain-containing protein [Magnetococcales bacterium]MBF0346265.1 STAS domain-containing protein [Magnetococcales bacterium]MBF0631544.1 STAS domain-containing protein [Magnetococcales bacterium]